MGIWASILFEGFCLLFVSSRPQARLGPGATWRSSSQTAAGRRSASWRPPSCWPEGSPHWLWRGEKVLRLFRGSQVWYWYCMELGWIVMWLHVALRRIADFKAIANHFEFASSHVWKCAPHLFFSIVMRWEEKCTPFPHHREVQSVNRCSSFVGHAYHLDPAHLYWFASSLAADSKLSKLCTAHLAYDSKEMKEPFGCVPTSSLIVQVSFDDKSQYV